MVLPQQAAIEWMQSSNNPAHSQNTGFFWQMYKLAKLELYSYTFYWLTNFTILSQNGHVAGMAEKKTLLLPWPKLLIGYHPNWPITV